MSDVTLLANQYAASAEFLEQINKALLQLKRARFGRTKEAAPSKTELRRSRNELARLIEAVMDALQDQGTDTMIVPEEVLQRLRSEYETQLSWRLPDLKEAVAALRNTGELSDKVIATLDRVCEVADATATESFRRLWRR